MESSTTSGSHMAEKLMSNGHPVGRAPNLSVRSPTSS